MANALLELVADHEVSLMRQLEEARAEAERIVEDAHAAAAARLQAVQQEMDSEGMARRKEAAEAREGLRRQIKSETERKVADIRQAVVGKTDHIRDEIIQMLLPRVG